MGPTPFRLTDAYHCKTLVDMTGTHDAERRDHQLTVRIPQRLRDALDREALAERRSVADIIVFMLEARYGAAKRTRKGGK